MKTIDELGISPTPWKCEAGGSPIDANNDYLDPTEAEARLIAAAPDMYEALEECERELDAIEPYCNLLEKVRSALAKASGEEDE